MSCSNNYKNSNMSYISNLGNMARRNRKSHSVLFSGDFLKVTVMSVDRGCELGEEVHENQDQLITVAYGAAVVSTGCTRCKMNEIRRINAGDSVFIPAGTWHNVRNITNGPLKLYSVYSVEKDEHDCERSSVASGVSQASNDCGYSSVASTVSRASDDCGCSSMDFAVSQASNDCGCGAAASDINQTSNDYRRQNTFRENLQARNDDDDYGCGRDCGC